MKSGIYTITNTVNGKMYVGSAMRLVRRFGQHKAALRAGTHHSPPLQAAWNKYGESAFCFDALESWGPEFLLSMEQWWINMLQPRYNTQPIAASRYGTRLSDETKGKIAAAHRGKKLSEEHRRKIGLSGIGRKMPPRPPMSEETKRKLSLAFKGRPSPMKGRRQSAGARAKMSASRTGKPSPLRGRKRPLDVVERAASKMRGRSWSAARRAAHERRKK